MAWWQWLLAGMGGVTGLWFVIHTGRDRTGQHDISRDAATNRAAAESMMNPIRFTSSGGP